MKRPQSEIPRRYLVARDLLAARHITHAMLTTFGNKYWMMLVNLLLFLLLELAVTRTWAARATMLCYNITSEVTSHARHIFRQR
jgi:hypothetical protein